MGNGTSGPQAICASTAGEAREARFRISSNCPESSSRFRFCAPFAIKVQLPGEKHPETRCQALQYSVIDYAEAMAHGMRGEFDTAWYVCEHMGRLIE